MSKNFIYPLSYIKKGFFFLFLGVSFSILVRNKIDFDYDYLGLVGSGPRFFSFIVVFYLFSSAKIFSKRFLILTIIYWIYIGQEFLIFFGLIGVYSLVDVLYYSVAYIYLYFFEIRLVINHVTNG